MTNAQQITLGGKQYEVLPLPLGRLKVAIPAFGRAGEALSAGRMDDATLNDIALILSAGLGKPVEEVEQIPATLPELAAAIQVVAEVSGLVERKPVPGEVKPEPVPASMTSTAG
jgi:hypothetical protein